MKGRERAGFGRVIVIGQGPRVAAVLDLENKETTRRVGERAATRDAVPPESNLRSCQVLPPTYS